MPFLTLLSKYSRVNTADQTAERETDRESKTETEVLLESREHEYKDLPIFLQPYLSVYQSVGPVSHLLSSSFALTFICSRQMGQLPW